LAVAPRSPKIFSTNSRTFASSTAMSQPLTTGLWHPSTADRLARPRTLGYGRTDAARGPLAERSRHGGHVAERARGSRLVADRSRVPRVLRRRVPLRARLHGAPGVDALGLRPRHAERRVVRHRQGGRRLDLHPALRVGRTAMDARDPGPLRLPALRLGSRRAHRALRARVPRTWRVQYLQRRRAHARLVVAAP